jgi:RNase adaptor protein for sRNA GlmZ degradation
LLKTRQPKTIIIQSFGFRFPDNIPKPPAVDAGIIYHLTDVRPVTPDPWPKFRESGEVEETFNEVMSRSDVKSFLETEMTVLSKNIQRLIASNDFHTLQINYGCIGGYQRSVAIAIWAYNLIREQSWMLRGNNLKIIHLTKHVCEEIKRQKELQA